MKCDICRRYAYAGSRLRRGGRHFVDPALPQTAPMGRADLLWACGKCVEAASTVAANNLPRGEERLPPAEELGDEIARRTVIEGLATVVLKEMITLTRKAV